MDKIKIITPRANRKLSISLTKLWHHRNLMYVFTHRDIRVQYAQTKIGIAWSFIQALTAAIIINLFFGILLKVSVPGIPYIIFAFPGMMAWYYFAYIVNSSGTVLMNSQNLIKKIYFPKAILPIYKTIVGLVEFFIWFALFMVMMIIYRIPLSINIIFLPFAIILNIISGLCIAFWLSALTVRYRDVLHIIPYLVAFGIFVTPVFFESTMIPAQYQFLIYFNPMAGVIALYRWCLLGMSFSINYLLGFIPTFLIFISGLLYFKKVEGTMSDLI